MNSASALNILFRSHDPCVRLISNLAHTPFVLHGRSYASMEAFWQGLKWPDESKRAEIAALHGHEARLAGAGAVAAEFISYQSCEIKVGSPDHWNLMRDACSAKFTQHDQAREALISTVGKPLPTAPSQTA